MHISEKKKGPIFFLHLYYFYCSGMPRVLSQTCCLLFLTLPSGNQILHIFCGAVQQGGNLLLHLTVLAWCRQIAQRRGMPWALWPLHFNSGESYGCVWTAQLGMSWESSQNTCKPGDVHGVQTPHCWKPLWWVNPPLDPLLNLAHLLSMPLIIICFL